jgi:hypothetical protein
MTRMRKALLLTMATMATAVAVAASAAQAELGKLTADSYPAFATGQAPGTVMDIGQVPHFSVSCGTARLKATLAAPVSPVTFDPTFRNCIGEPGGRPVTVAPNGCHFRFFFSKPGTTGQPASTGTLGAQLVCPAGLDMIVWLYESAGQHMFNNATCEYRLSSSGAVTAGTYHLVGAIPADVLLTLNMTFQALNVLGPTSLCGALAMQTLPFRFTGSYTLKGAVEVSGEEWGQIPLWVD